MGSCIAVTVGNVDIVSVVVVAGAIATDVGVVDGAVAVAEVLGKYGMDKG